MNLRGWYINNITLCKPILDRKFNIESISSLVQKLNGVKSITTRQMAIESSGEVCSISMLDGSRITIGGLFYKDDTDPGRASRTVFIVRVPESGKLRRR